MVPFVHLVFLGVLVGCARFEPKPLNPTLTAAALEGRTLDNIELKAFLETTLQKEISPWPPTVWDFDALTQVAFYYHPNLDLARAQWRISLGANKTAAGLNPTVTAAPGYDFSATGGVNPWIPGLSFDLPIETAGKRSYRRAHAENLSEAARLNILATAWQVRSNVRTNLIDFVASVQRELLLDQQSSVQEQVLRSLDQRLQAGALARSELAPARLARARLQLDLADAHRQTAEARVRLAEALGLPERSLEGVQVTCDLSESPASTNVLSSEARGLALRSRADILSPLAEYSAVMILAQHGFEKARTV